MRSPSAAGAGSRRDATTLIVTVSLAHREAASAEARDELAALLDDFEWMQSRSPQQCDYDVARLRRELGVERP